MENPKQLPKSNVSSQQWNHLYQAAQFSLCKHIQNRHRSLNENAVSDYYAYLSVNVAKKSLLKIDPEAKRNVCKGCEGLLLPGVTARIRILKKPSSIIEWKCIRCQTCKKFPSIRHYKPWFENSTCKSQNTEAQKNGQKIDSDYSVKIKVSDLGLKEECTNNVTKKMAQHMISDRESNSANVISELYLRSSVPVVDSPISPLEFYRDWVAPNLPVLIKGAVNHWPAIRKWNVQFLRDYLGKKLVTVAVTPNGYADAIATGSGELSSEYFVTPEERVIPMSEFLNALENNYQYPGVFYIQRQNSNLTEDFPELVPDVGRDVPWATEAFGREPEAANIWMGDRRAVTSMHKDPFENIYCVVSGYKDFILHPPTDRPWIPYKNLPLARYKEISPGIFDIIPCGVVQHSSNADLEKGNQQQYYYDDCPGGDASANFEVCNKEKALHNSLDEVTCNKSDEKSDLSNKNTDVGCHDDSIDGFFNYLSRLEIDDTVKVETKVLYEMYVNEHKVKNRNRGGPCHLCNKEIYKRTLTSSDDEDGSQDISQILSRSLSANIVPWICIDPLSPDFESYSLYRNATPVRVRVEAGDALYLPSLWFHHVQQSHACIAINYWYDMQYDLKYAYFQFLESLVMK